VVAHYLSGVLLHGGGSLLWRE